MVTDMLTDMLPALMRLHTDIIIPATFTGMKGSFAVTVTTCTGTALTGIVSMPVSTGAGWFSVTATAVASGSAAGAGLVGQAGLTTEFAELGTGFDRTVKAPVLVCALSSELPVRISTVWRECYPRPPRLESS